MSQVLSIICLTFIWLPLALAQESPLRVGVFLGSFDPPHLGHKAAILYAIQHEKLDLIYVFPDSSTHYKPDMQPFEHRLEMTRLLIDGIPQARVENMQNRSEFASTEMWDILEGIQNRHLQSQLYNILGNDTWDWLRLQPQIARLGKIIPVAIDRHQNGKSFSSTKVRRALHDGVFPPELSSAISDYIIFNNLYDLPAHIRCALSFQNP